MHWFFFLFFTLFFSISTFSSPLTFNDFPILSKERLSLTKEYSQRHYGIDSYHLHQPKMIVVHYTAISALEFTLNTFKPTIIAEHRTSLIPYGKLNVGVHFVVSPEGEIYSLLPTTIMGRHVTGYNHISIGIENVAATSDDLSLDQLKQNAALIAYLIDRHPSIKYLIGHHEYMHTKYPHYRFYTNKDKTYEPGIKVDPGFSFMKKLRQILKQEYDIELLN